jgi:hypothetical protein
MKLSTKSEYSHYELVPDQIPREVNQFDSVNYMLETKKMDEIESL